MDQAIAKAQALIEALNYIRKFRGRIVVVKIGGAVMDTPAALDGLLADVVFMATVGMQPIVVHGGGKAISAAMAEASLDVHFVQGQRYTDERALSVAEHVLVNQINAHIVETVVQSGSSAIGMHSLASCVLQAQRLFLEGDESQRIDIGLVGEVTKVQSQVQGIFAASKARIQRDSTEDQAWPALRAPPPWYARAYRSHAASNAGISAGNIVNPLAKRPEISSPGNPSWIMPGENSILI